ncbi:MAG: DUF1800 domain-containing protein [Acidobacteriota bacterium]
MQTLKRRSQVGHDAAVARSSFFGPRRSGLDPAGLERASRKVRLPQIPASLKGAQRRAVAAGLEGGPQARNARGNAANLEHRLIERATFGWTFAEQQTMDALGPEGYLERQLDAGSIDDGGLEQVILDALPTLSMSPYELYLNYELTDDQATPIYELWTATLFRAVYNPRQLYERMAHFWSDHFSIDIASDLAYLLKQADDRDVARRHALGSFPEMLRASARSPAMLLYLSNASNFVGHPNENYARELMELHTLGVDGGYTQEDVREVARCFTGWSISAEADPTLGTFVFYPTLHDDGPKTVLGQRIPAGGGMEDGERVLDILASHPATARFLGRKLLRWIWGYEPTDRMVEDIAAVYLATNGDIKSMLRSAFKWWRMARSTEKLKRPFHLVTSALRAPFAGIQNPFFFLSSLFACGHLPFNWAPPNGYPDSEGYWSGLVMPRWNFAGLYTLGDGENAAAVVDLEALDPQQSPDALTDVLDLLFTRGTLGDSSRSAIRDFLASRPAGAATVRDALGLAAASPEFQNY